MNTIQPGLFFFFILTPEHAADSNLPFYNKREAALSNSFPVFCILKTFSSVSSFVLLNDSFVFTLISVLIGTS